MEYPAAWGRRSFAVGSGLETCYTKYGSEALPADGSVPMYVIIGQPVAPTQQSTLR
jgi:hypothetical protein